MVQELAYREKTMKIGSGLIGISTEPAGSNASRGMAALPAIIILNSGIVHRVGTCRLSVKIARLMAQYGFSTIRYDSSGVGDSAARRDTLSFEESAPLEVKEVMNAMQRLGKASSFILVGLCSGADVLFESAKVDDRVAGMVQIDPYSYRNFKYYLHYYLPKVTKLTKWTNFFRRKISPPPVPEGSYVDDDDLELPTYIREFPPRSYIAEGYKIIAAKNVNLLAIFTAGAEDYCYESQFKDLFGGARFNQDLLVKHVTTSDHMITYIDQQKLIISIIEGWILSSWGDVISSEKTGEAA